MAARVELREGSFLARIELAGMIGARLHAAEALVDIGDEAGFGLLAVIHDVDARIDLAAYDVGDGLAHGLDVGLALGHQLLQRVGPGQAADMGRENAVLAFGFDRHGLSPRRAYLRVPTGRRQATTL